VSLPVNPLYGVAYGGGRFVAVSSSGLVFTSTDGAQWNQGTNLAAPFNNSVIWDGQRFIAVGSNRIFTSDDGLAWTLRLSPVWSLNCVGHGLGRSVAVGNSGTVLSSPDGLSWISHNCGTAASFQGVAYGHGALVAVGYGVILQSDPLVPVPPAIVQQPVNQVVRLGFGFTNRVLASGAPFPLYHWQRNGTNLPGATNTTYVVASAAMSDAGDYSVVVINPLGSVTSAVAAARVGVPPTVVVQPLSQSVVRGGSVTLSLQARGTLPLSFRWVRNGSTAQFEETGATTSYFTVTNIQATNTIRAAVTNAWGSALSSSVKIAPLGDADADGLPDDWETSHGLNPDDPSDGRSDADHDGSRQSRRVPGRH
jgi:hypothetical protein